MGSGCSMQDGEDPNATPVGTTRKTRLRAPSPLQLDTAAAKALQERRLLESLFSRHRVGNPEERVVIQTPQVAGTGGVTASATGESSLPSVSLQSSAVGSPNAQKALMLFRISGNSTRSKRQSEGGGGGSASQARQLSSSSRRGLTAQHKPGSSSSANAVATSLRVQPSSEHHVVVPTPSHEPYEHSASLTCNEALHDSASEYCFVIPPAVDVMPPQSRAACVANPMAPDTPQCSSSESSTRAVSGGIFPLFSVPETGSSSSQRMRGNAPAVGGSVPSLLRGVSNGRTTRFIPPVVCFPNREGQLTFPSEDSFSMNSARSGAEVGVEDAVLQPSFCGDRHETRATDSASAALSALGPATMSHVPFCQFGRSSLIGDQLLLVEGGSVPEGSADSQRSMLRQGAGHCSNDNNARSPHRTQNLSQSGTLGILSLIDVPQHL